MGQMKKSCPLKLCQNGVMVLLWFHPTRSDPSKEQSTRNILNAPKTLKKPPHPLDISLTVLEHTEFNCFIFIHIQKLKRKKIEGSVWDFLPKNAHFGGHDYGSPHFGKG